MTFAARTLQGGSAFTPVTHTYTTGSGTESVPAGATQAVITVQGAGAGGYFTFPSVQLGGGAGGEAIKTTSALPASFSYSVGAASAQNSDAPGGASTVSGGAVSLVANGGASAGDGGVGGTATGGDTNTTGGSRSGSTGGASPYGNGYGAGGSAIFPAAEGGIIVFAYS